MSFYLKSIQVEVGNHSKECYEGNEYLISHILFEFHW